MYWPFFKYLHNLNITFSHVQIHVCSKLAGVACVASSLGVELPALPPSPTPTPQTACYTAHCQSRVIIIMVESCRGNHVRTDMVRPGRHHESVMIRSPFEPNHATKERSRLAVCRLSMSTISHALSMFNHIHYDPAEAARLCSNHNEKIMTGDLHYITLKLTVNVGSVFSFTRIELL